MNTEGRTVLDIGLSVALMLGLLYASVKLLHKSGPLKYLGALLLAILIADLLTTSRYWAWVLGRIDAAEQQWIKALKEWEHVQGLA